jgi:hypothetical protein
MSRKANNKTKTILCLDCRHFKITWQPSHPRACSAMGFKTKNWPCFEVLSSSGEPCLKFSAKPNQEANKKTNLSDEGLSLKV